MDRKRILEYTGKSVSIVLILCMLLSMAVLLIDRRDYRNTVTLRFLVDGENSTELIVDKGELAADVPHPTKDGYLFVGWYLNEELTRSVDFSLPIKEDMTLYSGFIKLRSALSEDASDISISDCPKDISFYVETALSVDALVEGTYIKDELTGEDVLFGAAESGDGVIISASVNFTPGHTYRMALPDEARLGDVEKPIRNVLFTVASDNASRLVYGGEIVDIPEMNPSAPDVLHAYTEKEVSVGSTVLVGGKDKQLFKVTGIEKSNGGSCLLLGRLEGSDLSELELYGCYELSLSDGTLTMTESVPTGSVDKAEKLYGMLCSVDLGGLDGSYSAPEIIYDENGLKISLSAGEDGPFSGKCDLITLEYTTQIKSGGETCTVKISSTVLVSSQLYIYASKSAQGELLCDVSLLRHTASRTEAVLYGADGSARELDRDGLSSVIDRISGISAGAISKSIKEKISDVSATVLDGAVSVSVSAELFAGFDILADALCVDVGQVTSERSGVRICGEKTVAYRSVNTAIGSFDGELCGRADLEVGLGFTVNASLASSGIPLCSFSSEGVHRTESAGLFSAECSGDEKRIEGDAYVRAFAQGFAISGYDFENASADARTSLTVGKDVIVPSDASFKKNAYSVYGRTFDVRRILCEPLPAVSRLGVPMLYVPELSDVRVRLSGEYASRLVYNAQEGSITFDIDALPEACEIVMDVYLPSDTFDGDKLVPIHRTVTLDYRAAEPDGTVTATFTDGESVIAKKTVTRGEAPGFADVSNDILRLYPASSFSSLWDKDPYECIEEDTVYTLRAERLGVCVSFVTYADGGWNTSFEWVHVGEAPVLSGKLTPAWTCITPFLGAVEAGMKDPVRLTDLYTRLGSTTRELTESASFDNAAEAFDYARENSVCVYVADYSGETFDVKYTAGDETKEIKYDRNLLRAGFSSLIEGYTPDTAYALLFGGWEIKAQADHSASLSAIYSPARFEVTFADSDGSVLSREEVVIGEIPKGISKKPTTGGKEGVWLSSDYGNLADWVKYPAMTAIYRDTVITAYYGELYTVKVNADGGVPVVGDLIGSISLVPGEFDLSTLLPEMTKATDVVNSYTFDGWGVLNVTENTEIKAPFTAVPHIYRIELDADGGRAEGEFVLIAECTYPELNALKNKLLANTVPEKDPTETVAYTFTAWKQAQTSRPYTVRYKAEYFESERLYSVRLVAPDGGIFPCGESEIELSVPYKTVLTELDSIKYLARIPSDGETVRVISAWLSGDERIPLDADVTVTSDLVLNAEYAERENPVFKVTLDAGDGFFSNGSKVLVYEGRIGDPVPVPSVPSLDTAEGYTSIFLGWSGEIPEVFTSDVELKADYRQEKAVYTVTYYGLNSRIHAVYRVQFGDVIPIPDPPSVSGYRFIGWSGLPEGGIIGSTNLKIYARFDRNEHTVSYYVDGKLVDTETLYYGDKLLRRVYPYKPGYVFSGWSYPDLYYMPDRDLTVSGTFKKGKYVVTYVHNGNVYKTQSCTYGDKIKLPELPKGASLWMSTDVEIVDGCFVMPYDPITISTDSTGKTYTIEYTVDGKIISTGKYHFADKISPPSVPDDPRFTGRWVYRPKDGGGDVTVTDFMPGCNLVAVPELKIVNLLSGKDINKNGVDDYTDLIETAREYIRSHPIYESFYYSETGYPTDWYGVCTDVIWRAYFGIGVAFKDLVDSDIAYCKTLGEENPYKETQATHLIDFRRVVNLKVYYERNSTVLTTDTSDPTEWQPGDIVIFSPSHIGICSDKRDSEGLPYILHHTYSRGTVESDELGKFNVGDYEIVGHYRINVDSLK